MVAGRVNATLAGRVLGCVLACAVAPRPSAMEPTSLPGFEVADLDGAPVASPTLAREGKWLLLYVAPNSDASHTLLRLFKKERALLDVGRVVVLVSGGPQEARALRERCPALRDASWYADSRKTAAFELKLSGTPTVLGARDQRLLWCIDGAMSEPRHLESALASWLSR